ncbi:MAG: integrase [Alteromonadaceae bacterium]|jgi:integrase
MGSIQERSGTLYFDFRFKGIRCREQSKLDDTPANRKRMQKILKRIESEITLDQFDYEKYFPKSKRVGKFQVIADKLEAVINDESDGAEFEEFALLWLSEKEIEWRKSNYTTVKDVLLLHLIPAFGKKKLSEITKANILNFRSTLAKVTGRSNGKLSASRVNHIMTPLRVIMNEAAERYEFNSPWKNIKALPVPRTDIQPFSFDEVELFLEHVRPEYHCYFLTRFFTGLRTGEIDGLPWSNVDFDNRIINVYQAVVLDEMVPCKTDGSYRSIAMSDLVYQSLLKHQLQADKNQEFVFVAAKGGHLKNRYISRHVWYPALKASGLSKRNPYQTRHTAATLWMAAGESPEWIAQQMGHSSTTMLFRVYSRYVPNLTRQDGSAFERILSEKFSVNK